MKVYINNVLTDMQKQIRQQLTAQYPYLYSEQGSDKKKAREGRAVQILVNYTEANKDPFTSTPRLREHTKVNAHNNVPFDSKTGKIEAGSAVSEIRIADRQIKVKDGYKYAIDNSMFSRDFDFEGIRHFGEDQEVALWFFTFVSGMVQNNLCPEGYKNRMQPVRIDDPLVRATTAMSAEADIDKAVYLVGDKVDGVKDDSLVKLARALSIDNPATMDAIELRFAMKMLVKGDTSKEKAKIVLDFLQKPTAFDSANYVAVHIERGNLIYDSGTTSWKTRGGNVVLKVAVPVKNREEIVDFFEKDAEARKAFEIAVV